jgi:hypothetical protein
MYTDDLITLDYVEHQIFMDILYHRIAQNFP